MSSLQRRYYEVTYTFHLEQLSLKEYCVKVSHTPPVAARCISEGIDNFSPGVKPREYKTSSYSTPQEAFTHAKGWADCMEHFYFCCNHPPDDEMDSYKKKYDEKLKWHKENPDDQDKGSLFSEDAYKEGWDKNKSELNRDDLINFEKETDIKIPQSSVFQIPHKNVLIYLFREIDEMIRSKHFENYMFSTQANGEALASRISYVVHLLQKCPSQVEVDAINDLSATSQFYLDFKNLITYSHFWELMHEVHKCYYEVKKIQEGWFTLVHPNKEVARAEEYDIILTELTIGFFVGDPPDLRQEFFTLANQFPSPDMTLMSRVLRILFQYRLNSIQEVPLLEPNDFQICIGTTWEDFCKIRAALLAYADYCINLGNVLKLFLLVRVIIPGRKLYQRNMKDWLRFLILRTFL